MVCKEFKHSINKDLGREWDGYASKEDGKGEKKNKINGTMERPCLNVDDGTSENGSLNHLKGRSVRGLGVG